MPGISPTLRLGSLSREKSELEQCMTIIFCEGSTKWQANEKRHITGLAEAALDLLIQQSFLLNCNSKRVILSSDLHVE